LHPYNLQQSVEACMGDRCLVCLSLCLPPSYTSSGEDGCLRCGRNVVRIILLCFIFIILLLSFYVTLPKEPRR
ncbi:unnamed protein product, partial [Lampetra planeri]